MSLYIGLMSGTSMDGIDAALVSFDDEQFAVIGALTVAYPQSLRAALLRAVRPDARMSLHEFATLHVNVGRHFARAAMDVMEATGTPSGDVLAIGSHGQTLRHSPDTDPPYSVQIGDAATIATLCSITTVADFRSLDLAAGGQGAPLVPAFHAAYFRDPDANTVVVNIGGIGNVTVLPAAPSDAVSGFDTGPGNCLLDEWISQEYEHPYDDDGRWAASGHPSEILLNALMADEYIQRRPPKSTGREYFNLEFLRATIAKVGSPGLTPVDVQATLAEYTVTSIVHGIEQSGMNADRVLVCGGGANNAALMRGLRDSLPRSRVASTAALGIEPDVIEALAFAWLSKQRLELRPVRLTTGSAANSRLLGAVYEPSP